MLPSLALASAHWSLQFLPFTHEPDALKPVFEIEPWCVSVALCWSMFALPSLVFETPVADASVANATDDAIANVASVAFHLPVAFTEASSLSSCTS
jgi:hypothetical protein